MSNNQSNRAPVHGYKDTYVEFEKEIYREGEFRLVYMGTFHGDHRVEGKRCVVKVNKEPYSYKIKEYAWKLDSRTYEQANEMAKLFNSEYLTSKPIEFVKPEFTTVDRRAASNFHGYQPYGKRENKEVTVAVERFIDGNYEKFVSNVGIMCPKKIVTPAAFCHYTYHVTNGEILVCDIQGVRTNSAYILTDPSVHSCSPKRYLYGLSDLGKFGIVKFFENHTCNALCKGLKVPRVVDCLTGALGKFEKVVDQIPTGAEEIMPTIQLNTCGVPEDELQELQTNVGIVAVPSH